MLRTSPIKKKSPKAIESKYELTEIEKKYVERFMGVGGMMKIFPFGDNNVARASIIDIILYLLFEETEFQKKLLEQLMARLSHISYREFPLHLMAIESLFQLNDSVKEDIILSFLCSFIELTKSHITQSYIAFSYVTDLFIKFALQLESIRERVKEEGEKFDHVERWLKKHEYPATSISFFQSKYMFWEKTPKNTITIKPELTSEDKSLCKAYNKQKINILALLKQKKKPIPDIASIKFAVESYVNARELDMTVKSMNKCFDVRYEVL